MIHLDLFSGLGGFALAVDAVWDDAEHIFCEIDPYCQALLKKRFERSIILDDIRKLTTDAYRNRLQEQGAKQQTSGDRQLPEVIANAESGKPREQTEQEGRENTCGRDIELLTGGFPCQPFSQAGKRRGTDDNRYLWPEMLRVIRNFKPAWVIAENVRGLLTINEGMVFEQVCLDLEGEGYEVQPFIIPAVAVNAPHRRDRVWIVAYTSTRRLQRFDSVQTGEKAGNRISAERNSDAFNSKSTKCKQSGETRTRRGRFTNESWNQNWLEVATELCGMDDGLPAELDGLKLSKSRHRVERLKALGNAIVPQVAIEIMKAIKAQGTLF
jgi:DNA (cytosine-5)-methyltransferase 1